MTAVSSALKTVEDIHKAITRRLKRIYGSGHWELSQNSRPAAERLVAGFAVSFLQLPKALSWVGSSADRMGIFSKPGSCRNHGEGVWRLACRVPGGFNSGRSLLAPRLNQLQRRGVRVLA